MHPLTQTYCPATVCDFDVETCEYLVRWRDEGLFFANQTAMSAPATSTFTPSLLASTSSTPSIISTATTNTATNAATTTTTTTSTAGGGLGRVPFTLVALDAPPSASVLGAGCGVIVLDRRTAHLPARKQRYVKGRVTHVREDGHEHTLYDGICDFYACINAREPIHGSDSNNSSNNSVNAVVAEIAFSGVRRVELRAIPNVSNNNSTLL